MRGGVLAESLEQAHPIEAMDAVMRRLGVTARIWRVDRLATAITPGTRDVQPSFAPVAKHYRAFVEPCPPRRENRKGSVESAVRYLSGRWWRTLTATTPQEAQVSLDRFLAGAGDARPCRTEIGGRTTSARWPTPSRCSPCPPRCPCGDRTQAVPGACPPARRQASRRRGARGLEDMFTVARLGVGGRLRRWLTNTNCIESMISITRTTTGRVKHWRDGTMKKRWIAAGMLESRTILRRIIGHAEMPVFVAAITAATRPAVTPPTTLSRLSKYGITPNFNTKRDVLMRTGRERMRHGSSSETSSPAWPAQAMISDSKRSACLSSSGTVNVGGIKNSASPSIAGTGSAKAQPLPLIHATTVSA